MQKLVLFLMAMLFGSFGYSQTIILEENFDNTESFPPNWLNIDKDGDGLKWKLRENAAGDKYAYSESWADNVVLYPENYLITPGLDLTGFSSGAATLSYVIGAADDEYFAEHYKLVLSTEGTDIETFTKVLLEETLDIEAWYGWPRRNVDLTPYLGQRVWLAWVHFDCYDQYRLLLDSIVVKHDLTSDLQKNSREELAVYPNPVKDKLYLQGVPENAVIELMSMDGKLVYNSATDTNKRYINVKSLENGLYIMRVKNKEEVFLRKIYKI